MSSFLRWLAGRLLLLLLILALLVAWDAYRDESRQLWQRVTGLAPDPALLARLESQRESLRQEADAGQAALEQRLGQAWSLKDSALDQRIAAIERALAATRRPSAFETLSALTTGEGVEAVVTAEVRVALLEAELDGLRQVRRVGAQSRMTLGETRRAFEDARQRLLRAQRLQKEGKSRLDAYRRAHPLRSRMLWQLQSREGQQLFDQHNARTREFNQAGRDYLAARDRRDRYEVLAGGVVELRRVGASVLEPLDAAIAREQATIREAARIRDSAQRMLRQAIGLLILVTLAPVLMKALWYFILAPLAATRPPIRLQPWAGAASPAQAVPREKLSAVSTSITIGDGEELLVHPDYLQSSADRGRKDTKWLLHWRYPFTSLAAGMVGLTRIRSTSPEVFVVSSRHDPLAEVGEIRLVAREALVLQPRHLVGLVQPIDAPLRIHRRWVFGLSALITLQFRYLVFEGPGTLLVQGCRGVRLEPAGSGRSVDQKATMGFSAHLPYAPRRSETFGAYLMGASGLFNDRFVGDTGYFVYEEMPNAARRAGLGGRGLEGVTDAVLRVLGV